MLPKVLLPLIGLSLLGCSAQQAQASKTQELPDPAEQAQLTAKPHIQPIEASEEQRAKLLASGKLDNKLSEKDKPVKTPLFDAKLIVTDKINVTLQYTNHQSYAVPLMFRSGMTADLWLIDPQGKKLWAWSNEMMFTQAIREVVMPAGKTQNVKFRLPVNMEEKLGKGYRLTAVFAGQATESQRPAMAKVVYDY